MLTKTAHALRAWSTHRRCALSPYPRDSCPADTINSCPSQVAPRATRTALPAHTHPLAENPNQNPKQPSSDLPPPPPYPPRIAAAAPRSIRRRRWRHGGHWQLNNCESAGSTQCLLAAAPWCQRWLPALATCVHAPAPPATPLSARSEWAVAAAEGGGSNDARSSLYEGILQWFHWHRPIALQVCVARGRG
jgi:hypothetical protein